jgi:hypothetical protein
VFAMPRASTVVKLVLLGSTLGLIGWAIYGLWDYPWSGGSGHHGGGYYYRPHGWFYGGGGYSGGTGPAQSGGVTRGGFGAHGAVGGGE